MQANATKPPVKPPHDGWDLIHQPAARRASHRWALKLPCGDWIEISTATLLSDAKLAAAVLDQAGRHPPAGIREAVTQLLQAREGN